MLKSTSNITLNGEKRMRKREDRTRDRNDYEFLLSKLIHKLPVTGTRLASEILSVRHACF